MRDICLWKFDLLGWCLSAIVLPATQYNRYKGSIYLVFDFCEHDLAGLLSNTNVKFTLAEIKKVMQMLLNGLYYIHRNKVGQIHSWSTCSSFVQIRRVVQKNNNMQMFVVKQERQSQPVWFFTLLIEYIIMMLFVVRSFTETWRRPTCSSPETASWNWLTSVWLERSAWPKTAKGTATPTVWSHCGTDLRNCCWVRRRNSAKQETV